MSQFGVFLSTDNLSWTKVIAATYSGRAPYGGSLETFDFPDAQARYVRVYSYGHTGTYSPPENNSISEIGVWAQPDANSNLCHIKAFVQPATDDQGQPTTSLGTPYYNTAGTLDSIIFTVPNNSYYSYSYDRYTFDHDASSRITKMTAKDTRVQFPSGRKFYFTWSGNRVVRIQTYSDMASNAITMTDYDDSLVYDAQGRVIREYATDITYSTNPPYPSDTTRYTLTYNYDANGNRIRPGYTYDGKTNFLSTDPFLQLLMRDYSRSNPVTARGYTVRNLPVGFAVDEQHKLPYGDERPDGILFFGSQYLMSLTYTCQP